MVQLGQLANAVHESCACPQLGRKSIKFGLKGQVTYIKTAEKGAIGKIAVRSLRNNSIEDKGLSQWAGVTKSQQLRRSFGKFTFLALRSKAYTCQRSVEGETFLLISSYSI